MAAQLAANQRQRGSAKTQKSWFWDCANQRKRSLPEKSPNR